MYIGVKIENLSQLKKALTPGTKFQIVEHFIRPEHNGEIRTVTKLQTNAIYSNIPEQPDNKINSTNNGLGYWFEFGKAKEWTFTETAGGAWLCTQAGVFTIAVLKEV